MQGFRVKNVFFVWYGAFWRKRFTGGQKTFFGWKAFFRLIWPLLSRLMRPWGLASRMSLFFVDPRPSLFVKTPPEPKNRVIYDIFGDYKYKNVLHQMTRVQKRIRRWSYIYIHSVRGDTSRRATPCARPWVRGLNEQTTLLWPRGQSHSIGPKYNHPNPDGQLIEYNVALPRGKSRKSLDLT